MFSQIVYIVGNNPVVESFNFAPLYFGVRTGTATGMVRQTVRTYISGPKAKASSQVSSRSLFVNPI